ncbi:phosphopantothenoylcysteine decarboxylase [Trichuris trichiura]|uniref:Phosphopantothenoylcysteine decarboxylase n=1 Tax=Trichuris trichiura TaxID=36087 RepID=A0A077ZDC5_TRITR|nr:phosphopantothenoylcysteine decarboxylase [Trichuris trichiura]
MAESCSHDETAPTLKRPCAAMEAAHSNSQEKIYSFRKIAGTFNLLIGCTGSVASIKVPEIVDKIKESCSGSEKIEIRIVATEKSLTFFDSSLLNVPIYRDSDEWNCWKRIGDPVIHIELRRWADAMVLAPLDANSLAKIANGLCDNLLTCVVRAWDSSKPLYFCPAMNTYMWNSPLMYKQMDTLKTLLGFREIPCIEKKLACGDNGLGAMASVAMIVSVVGSLVKNHFAIYTG